MMVCERAVDVRVRNPPAVVLDGRLIALANSDRSFALALVGNSLQSVLLLPRP